MTLAAWGGVPGGSFQYDDHRNVVGDPATATTPALAERLRTGIRPLLRLSYHVDHRLWGMDARGFLATNLLLHVLTVAGVWALARRRLGDEAAALAAALVFAVQPAHAEVVAYVSGRSTGLMTLLLVAGLLAHERARTAGRAWRAASLGCFAAACLVKEVALVFPALLLLWEWTRAGTARVPRALVVATAALAAGLAGVLALSPRYRTLAAFSHQLASPADSLATNLRVLPSLLSLWGRPWALSVDHEPPEAAAIVAGGAVVVALLGLALRRRPAVLALAAGWVLLALAPTNSIVAKLDPMTEKPLYLAWIGPALAAGALATAARRRLGTRGVVAVAVAVAVPVLAFGIGWSQARVAVWSDARRLWADAAAKAPSRSRPWVNLGVAWLDHDPAEAARALREGLRRDPGDASARRTLMTAEVLCGQHCERRTR